jgi:hypothetical protein
LVLSGAIPRGTTDALVVCTIAIAGFNYSPGSTKQVLLLRTWLLLFTIALVTVLASRADTSRKLREELALIAYGGSGWQVWLRYFLRGLACTLLASTPLFYALYFQTGFPFQIAVILTLVASTVGGLFYAAPSIVRIHSREFAENYKG